MPAIRQTTFPSRLVTVAASTSKEPAPGRPGYHEVSPMTIISRHSRIEAGRNGRIQTGVFTNGREWAGWLSDRLRHEGVTWVVVHRLGDMLRLLGFFALVDDGLFHLLPPETEVDKLSGQPKAVSPAKPLAIVEDFPTAIKAFTSSGQKLLLCDLRNWIDCSLDDLAESLGFDRLHSKPGLSEKDVVESRLVRDLEIQERTLLSYMAWLKSRGVRDFRLTAASQALSFYKQRHRPHRPAWDAEPEVRKLERDGMWGGKVVASYVGHAKPRLPRPVTDQMYRAGSEVEEPPGQLYHLDATSLYGFLMRDRLFPFRLVEWVEEAAEPWIGPPHWGLDLVANVVIDSKSDTYPVKDGRRTLWATGCFRTTLPGPELARAVRRGHVREWGVYARYDLADLFSGYVNELWILRSLALAKGDKMYARVAKTMINCLWGKFNAKTPTWVEAPDPGFGERWGLFHHIDGTSGEITKFRALAGLYQREEKPVDAPDAYPAISAWLTSYGRCYIDEIVALAGPKSVYYVAVDALVVSEAGFFAIAEAGAVEPSTLGKLRVTGRHRVGKFGGYNRYSLDGVRHASGLKLDACEVAEGVYVQCDRGRLVPALLAGERTSLISHDRLIDFRRNVVYGKVGHDGWVSPPIVDSNRF